MIEILKSFVFAGSIVFGIGLFFLTMLQIMLMVRFKKFKFIFTFLPALFYPDYELLDKEKIIRRTGIVLCVVGAIPILVSFILT